MAASLARANRSEVNDPDDVGSKCLQFVSCLPNLLSHDLSSSSLDTLAWCLQQIEFIVAALLDMNEVDGGNGASLLAQYASSPDVATRLVHVVIRVMQYVVQKCRTDELCAGVLWPMSYQQLPLCGILEMLEWVPFRYFGRFRHSCS